MAVLAQVGVSRSQFADSAVSVATVYVTGTQRKVRTGQGTAQWRQMAYVPRLIRR
jgi:hypothetical protein